jgi:hypothetical protein
VVVGKPVGVRGEVVVIELKWEREVGLGSEGNMPIGNN